MTMREAVVLEQVCTCGEVHHSIDYERLLVSGPPSRSGGEQGKSQGSGTGREGSYVAQSMVRSVRVRELQRSLGGL